MNKFEQQYRQWGAIALVSMVTMLLIIAILDYLLEMDFSRNFYIAALIGASFLMGIISMSWIQVLNTRLMRADVKKANNPPIPQEEARKITQDDIAMCTALAGEMLGLKIIYMDAGSGALEPISADMIAKVKHTIEIPLIVGGGINTPEKAANAAKAGADIIVVGNALEKSIDKLQEFADAVHGN